MQGGTRDHVHREIYVSERGNVAIRIMNQLHVSAKIPSRSYPKCYVVNNGFDQAVLTNYFLNRYQQVKSAEFAVCA